MTGAAAVDLGDLAESVEYGLNASAADAPVGPKFLRITDIQNGAVDWDAVPWCRADKRDIEKARLSSGDIVFARTGATTGKSFLLRGCPENAVYASYLIRVRLGPKADPRYVSHFFQTPSYWAQVSRTARGVAQPGVNGTKLRKLRIPLPSLAEQRRIADVLDHAEALRARRREALSTLDSLVEASFVQLFDGCPPFPVDVNDGDEGHPKGWTRPLLTDVARLATGHTPDRQEPSYWNGGVPWITLTDIRALDGVIAKSTSETISEEGIANSAAVRLPAGTVCFSRTASLGFVTMMGREMATSQDFVNWVCGPRLLPLYLMHALIRSRVRLRGLARGSTHKTLYFPTVERFRLLLPPLELQADFARRVEKIDEVRRIQVRAQALLDELYASLQHRAFSGAL